MDDWRLEELMHIIPSTGVDAVAKAVAEIQAAYPARVRIRYGPGEIGILLKEHKAVVLELKLLKLVDNERLNSDILTRVLGPAFGTKSQSSGGG